MHFARAATKLVGDRMKEKNRERIDIAAIRTYLEVCEHGSFTHAARSLGKTQSAVSQQLHRLEADLGQDLFRWDRRRFALTPAGEILRDYGAQIVALVDEATRRIEDSGQPVTVRLGTNQSRASQQCGRLLRRLQECSPPIRFTLKVAPSRELFTALQSGHLDVVVALPHPEFPRGELLRRDQLHWVRGPDFSWSGDEPLPLVLTTEGSPFRPIVLDELTRRGFRWNVTMSNNNLLARQGAVVSGVGIAPMLPSEIVPPMVPCADEYSLPPLPEPELCLYFRPSANVRRDDLREVIHDVFADQS